MRVVFWIGALLLFVSCASKDADEGGDDALMTDFSENMTMKVSEAGRMSYKFSAPLVEGYSLAQEPYREFREGIDITTYLKDSLDVVDTHLTANYAINYPDRRLWEAKGNVVIRKSDGQEMHTQQIFWNEQTGRVWSNVDTRIVQGAGRGDMIVEGFESDQEFKNWTFRRIKGRMLVDTEPTEQPDSIAT